MIFFVFWAHAVHARGSDGHQNVLSLISYSHILENRWSKKPGVFQHQNKTNPTKNKTKTPRDTQRTRWDTTLSEKKSSGRSVLLHDDIAIPANRCPKSLQVTRSYSRRWWSCISLNKGGELVHPRPRRWSCRSSINTYVVATIQPEI